jgi:hypothetical protein
MLNIEIFIDDEFAMNHVIDFSDKTEEFIRGWDKFIDLLPMTPEVVEYTSLGVTPELNDSWDGKNFISKDGSDFHPIGNASMRWFALVIDGLVKWIFQFPDDITTEGFIAALLSNPTLKIGS